MTSLEAIARAVEGLWLQGFKDKNRKSISTLFSENGFQWHLDKLGTDGLYDGTPGLEYCGHTIAVAGRRMGDYIVDGQCVDATLDADLARLVLPSTARLASDTWWDKAGWTRNTADEVTRGAVCTVNSDTHIVCAVSAPGDDGEFDTVEGNAWGRFPDGTSGKGIVRRTRNISDVSFIYHFGPEHIHGTFRLEV